MQSTSVLGTHALGDVLLDGDACLRRLYLLASPACGERIYPACKLNHYEMHDTELHLVSYDGFLFHEIAF
eukprot:2706939-Pleurochrysis_carterae.AAC.2